MIVPLPTAIYPPAYTHPTHPPRHTYTRPLPYRYTQTSNPSLPPTGPHHHRRISAAADGTLRGDPQADGVVVRGGGEEVRVRGAEGHGGDDAAVAAVWLIVHAYVG